MAQHDQIEVLRSDYRSGFLHSASGFNLEESAENQLASLQQRLIPAHHQDVRTIVHMASFGDT